MSIVDYIKSLLARRERGQTLAEYALILAFIAVVAVAVLLILGGEISNILSFIGNELASRPGN
jgi:Flp pilus assembly pilin Flp